MASLLAHEKAGVRRAAALALALSPAAAPRDLYSSNGAAWQALVKALMDVASRLLWHLDGLSDDGSPGKIRWTPQHQPSCTPVPAPIRWNVLRWTIVTLHFNP